MTENTYDTLTLVGRHVPDPAGGPFESMDHARAAGHDVINPVTGMYEIGAIIEGAFVPLLVEKASLVFDRIERAKGNAAPMTANEPTETGPQADEHGTYPSSTDQPQG